jgi:hypothetical protein
MIFLIHLIKHRIKPSLENILPDHNESQYQHFLHHYESILQNMFFLDDPTQGVKLSIHWSHYANLDGPHHLCTGLLDYLIQQSIKTRKAQRTIVASTLSLSIMQTYLQSELNAEQTVVVSCCKENKLIQKNYEYFSFGEFNFYCLVCQDKHFYLVSLQFNINDPYQKFFKNVKVYDSLKLVTNGCAKKTVSFQRDIKVCSKH